LPTHLVPIARVLADRGHDLAVFNPAPAPVKLIEDAGSRNLPVARCADLPGRQPFAHRRQPGNGSAAPIVWQRGNATVPDWVTALSGDQLVIWVDLMNTSVTAAAADCALAPASKN